MPVGMILAVSFALQLCATIVALWLTRISTRRFAWAVITAALLLMAIRRALTLHQFVVRGVTVEPMSEAIGMLVSLYMLAGVAVLAPLFWETMEVRANYRKRAAQQAAVAALGQLALAGASLKKVFDDAVTSTARELGVELIKVLELMPDRSAFRFRAGVGWKEGYVGSATVSADTASQAGYTLLSKQPVVVEDVSAEDRFEVPSLLTEHGVVSGISVAIGSAESPFGVLGAHTTRRVHFTQDDVNFLQAVANVLAAAVQRQRAEQEIRRLNTDLERRVEERTAELEATTKELEDLSYSVSHDLQAPLRAIDGYSQALLEDCGDRLDAPARTYLERTRMATRRMAELIDALLSLVRTARQRLTPTTVDLTAAARAIARRLQQAEPDRRVEVVIQDGIVGYGDEALLQSVLEKLLSNAWQFTREKDHAHIAFGRRRAGTRDAYFVEDNGRGFDPSYSRKLFEPFQHAHGEQQPYPGRGIGLATVERIIRRHRGRVWAEGDPGVGATFYFTLGAARAADGKLQAAV